jgi:isopenicillin N synthase-like dioxygenase
LASFEWHDEKDLPGFKEVFLRFLAQCEELSYRFIDFITEALGLEKDALRIFFDPVMQHRAKVRERLPMWRFVGGY